MKFPWVKFFIGDWLKDPQLSGCSPATRGIWIDAICAMQELRNATLVGPPDKLARVLRCNEAELAAAIDELQVTGAATVTLRNKNITLTCRRLERDFKYMENNRLRQKRYRHNAARNAPIDGIEVRSQISDTEKDNGARAPCAYCGATEQQTGFAHELDHFIPVSSGGTDSPENLFLVCHRCNQAKQGRIFATVEECREWLHRAYWASGRNRWVEHRKYAFGGIPPEGYKDLFDRFWTVYPRHEPSRMAAEKAWYRLAPNEELVNQMLAWISRAKLSDQWQDPKLIPHATTWLEQRRWEGDPPPCARPRPVENKRDSLPEPVPLDQRKPPGWWTDPAYAPSDPVERASWEAAVEARKRFLKETQIRP